MADINSPKNSAKPKTPGIRTPRALSPKGSPSNIRGSLKGGTKIGTSDEETTIRTMGTKEG